MHCARVQAQPVFCAAFELLPVAYSLLSGRRASSAASISDGDLRSLGDLSWLTGLLLLGTDCSRPLSLPWAACVKKVRASMGKTGTEQQTPDQALKIVRSPRSKAAVLTALSFTADTGCIGP